MKNKPRNNGKKWTKTENALLKRLANTNTPTPIIAKKLERTENAIYNEASSNNISLMPRDK